MPRLACRPWKVAECMCVHFDCAMFENALPSLRPLGTLGSLGKGDA